MFIISEEVVDFKVLCSNPGQDMVGFFKTQPACSSLADFQWARKFADRHPVTL